MRIQVIHWNREEALERVSRLEALGHEVKASWGEGGDDFSTTSRDLPQVVVVDLSRLPSHGRQVAIALREKKSTRSIPLVFVDGADDKVAKVTEALPDAIFTSWRAIRGALTKASRGGPENPIVPRTTSGYSGTTLPKKLGIRSGSKVAILGAPKGFERLLEGDGVTVKKTLRGSADVIVLFASKISDLDAPLRRSVESLAEGGGLWLAWPKKTSGMKTDVDQDLIRERGLATGLVDNKVCAIDESWSGLRFMRRKKQPQ